MAGWNGCRFIFKHADERVFQQIFDARAFNPNTVMPPNGPSMAMLEQNPQRVMSYFQDRRVRYAA